MSGDVKEDKGYGQHFSLQEVLAGDKRWIKCVSDSVWINIRRSPTWRQICDLNSRVEAIESKLVQIDNKLEEILIILNGMGEGQT